MLLSISSLGYCVSAYTSSIISVTTAILTPWGSSFREDYSRLCEVRSLIPTDVHVMAMTATATSRTRANILTGLVRCSLILSSACLIPSPVLWSANKPCSIV